MLATTLTAAVVGVDAHLVRVEADAASGFPGLTMLGLPDSAVRESVGRIRAALRNCGYAFKWDRRITVNMAPASLRKTGSSYDLATAVGLLATDGVLTPEDVAGRLLVGELALDGTLRPVPGVLPMMLLARERGLDSAVVPAANANEAALAGGVRVHPARTLLEAVDWLRKPGDAPTHRPRRPPRTAAPCDLAEVRGQALARRALEVAAAGGHNLLLWGPPGSGKTMLARRLPSLLPELSEAAALETTAIHSASGRRLDGVVGEPPFRSPHHTVSPQALVGGGAVPRPGEVSLAHNGVLFLDELAEFSRAALEALREPLEERHVTISRVRGCLNLPARFQLVAATNPCPCGRYGDRGGGCTCTPGQIAAYRGRLSGPLLDRIDLHVCVESLRYQDLAGPPGEASEPVRRRVRAARERQALRQREGRPGPLNADLRGAALRDAARASDASAERLLEAAVDRMGLSARGHDRLLRVARTLADLEGAQEVAGRHLAEALQFRATGQEAPSRSIHWRNGS